MSFVVIIPARFASSRLPKKVLADLGGKPMIIRVVERVAQSGAARIVVATDHNDIYFVCQTYGINVVMTDINHFCGTDRIAEAATILNLTADTIIVNVQGDEPLINPNIISLTAAKIKSNIPMATAAHIITSPSKFNSNIVKVVLDKNKRAIYFSRAAIPWQYHKHGNNIQKNLQSLYAYKPLQHIGLYAYTNKFLQIYSKLTISPLEKIESLEQLRALWHGYMISVYVTHSHSETGVDTLEDLERIRKFF